MAKEAVDNALAKIGAGHVETGVYKVILDKYEMASLLSAFSPIFSAKNAQDGLSLLAGKEGEKIAADCVTITDDPFREGYELQTHFDAEGAATHRKKVIEKGTLKTLLHNLATAKKAGIETTGNASKSGYSGSVEISPYCFCIEGSDMTEEELFALAENAIYVTDLMGLHAGVNFTTGDFSVDASGSMIENGKKGRPVKTFTIAGNFFDLLKNIEAVSDNVKIGMGGFTAFGAPSVLIKDISVAG
jgi:PmbA protein